MVAKTKALKTCRDFTIIHFTFSLRSFSSSDKWKTYSALPLNHFLCVCVSFPLHCFAHFKIFGFWLLARITNPKELCVFSLHFTYLKDLCVQNEITHFVWLLQLNFEEKWRKAVLVRIISAIPPFASFKPAHPYTQWL